MDLIRRERREAAAELLAQARYYEGQRAGLGTAFMDAVDAAIAAIEAFPDAAGPYPGWDREPMLRLRHVEGFPVGIVYLVDGRDLVVFAYAHHRRAPGYWLGRLDP
ncbi:MAG: type II toxin-antitoxin system RelE/ParE family toxin [Bifidobacteriaceae bacterium]|nr:type II toxin-antitoxin system RelE/ParE family toxin [Bifidobacteriaceae bacterium]